MEEGNFRCRSAFSGLPAGNQAISESNFLKSRSHSQSTKILSFFVNDADLAPGVAEDEGDDFEERRPRGSRSIPSADIPASPFVQSTEPGSSVFSTNFRSGSSTKRVFSDVSPSNMEKKPKNNLTNIGGMPRIEKLQSKDAAFFNENSGDRVTNREGGSRSRPAIFGKTLEKLHFMLNCLYPVINFLKWAWRLMLEKICGRRTSTGSQFRTVIPNHMFPQESINTKNNPNNRYSGNKIKTTKYTLFTFLPKNLFEQFHRFANLYFIFIVFLNWFPQIEAFGKELSMIPVLFVLTVTAIKDIYEDKRREDDRYIRTEWKFILVGDIVHLSCNEIIPADILLLNSSDAAGVCFVETSNLDGESNLKQRQVIGTLQGKQTFLPNDFRSTIECEVPNNQIYRFNGFLLHSDGTREPINRNNLLLRGCEIRNTDFVEGIVVYAGHETKAMLNNSGPRYKRSKLERLMNWDIIWCVVILVILCFIGAVGNGLWLNSFHNLTDLITFLPFVQNTGKMISPQYEAFIVFWSYVIILQVMIPISLYVSIEIVKLGQVFFITQDKQLCHAKKRIQCRALNITEELGQIQYVMCDKTGTLTENLMIFRRCAVAGADYGSTEVNTTNEQKNYESVVSAQETSKDVQPNRHLHKLLVKICHEIEDKHLPAPASVKKQAILDFFINMAVCNTVVVNPHPHKDSMNASGVIAPEILQRLTRNAAASASPMWDDEKMAESLGHGTEFALNMPKSVLRIESIGAHDYAYPVTAEKGGTGDEPSVQGVVVGESTDIATAVKSAETCPPKVHFEVPAIKFESASGGRGSSFRTNSGAIRRMSQSVPLFHEIMTDESNLPEKDKFENLHLSSQAERLNHSLKSEPDLTSRADTVGAITAKYAVWTANLGKFWHDLPPLMSKLKLPPLHFMLRKSPSNDLSPVGYKNPFYEAESPDELALVYAAAAYGVRLVKRQTGHVTVETPDGRLLKYQLLNVLPFDATRKRMSVVVKEPKNGKILLFVKGADSSVMDLMSKEYLGTEHGRAYYNKAIEHTNFYASHGLRTLWLAKKEISPTLYATWAEQHVEAEMSMEDRDELIFESAVRLECGLELCGVTGIEDRLQDGVAECIDSLRRGGLKVWVLTGDKIETAVNIAYACKLFVFGMDLIQLSARNEEDAEILLQHHIDNLADRNSQSLDEAMSCSSTVHPNKVANGLGLVVDGRTLTFCLSSSCEDKFVQIVVRCTSVLCCRATPLQKAAIVRLVKRRLNGMTLAIGDGANDVSMIQCADVGVGISGQEGMQAVMASDFAMARFRFLHRLLFVHGHWCYDRISRIVCYFFYKNALFVFTSFWFQIWNGFSAQLMIDPLYLMLYNLVFTSLSPILMGVFDQDASDQILLTNPHLYALGSKGQLYTWHSFWLNILDAFWQSVVVFYVPFFISYDSNANLWEFGFLITSCLVVVNQMHLAMQIMTWLAFSHCACSVYQKDTMPMAVSIFLSIGIFFAFALAYNAVSISCCAPDAPFFVAEHSMKNPLFWLCLIFVTVICLIPRESFC